MFYSVLLFIISMFRKQELRKSIGRRQAVEMIDVLKLERPNSLGQFLSYHDYAKNTVSKQSQFLL